LEVLKAFSNRRSRLIGFPDFAECRFADYPDSQIFQACRPVSGFSGVSFCRLSGFPDFPGVSPRPPTPTTSQPCRKEHPRTAAGECGVDELERAQQRGSTSRRSALRSAAACLFPSLHDGRILVLQAWRQCGQTIGVIGTLGPFCNPRS